MIFVSLLQEKEGAKIYLKWAQPRNKPKFENKELISLYYTVIVHEQLKAILVFHLLSW